MRAAGVTPPSDPQTARVSSSAAHLAEVMHRVPRLVVPCIESRPEDLPHTYAAALYGSMRSAERDEDRVPESHRAASARPPCRAGCYFGNEAHKTHAFHALCVLLSAAPSPETGSRIRLGERGPGHGSRERWSPVSIQAGVCSGSRGSYSGVRLARKARHDSAESAPWRIPACHSAVRSRPSRSNG